MRVLIASDESLFRDAAESALGASPQPGFAVATCPLAGAVHVAASAPPDVVVLAGDRGADVLPLVRALARSEPRFGILVLSAAWDHDSVLEALSCGVRGFLTYGSSAEVLGHALACLQDGEVVIPQSLLSSVWEHWARVQDNARAAVDIITRLTEREREVLVMLVEGASTDDIARDMVISPQTVRTHVQRILPKLGVHSRLEAVVLVREKALFQHLKSDGTFLRSPAPAAGGPGKGR